MTSPRPDATRPLPDRDGSGAWVLLATDGSAAAQEATRTVRDSFQGAEVVVLTVVDGRSVADAAAADAIQDRTSALLDRPCHRLVRGGRPVAAIRDVAEHLHVDVLAIGAPTPRRGLRISTGARLLRCLDCDVLLVPPRRERPDGSAQS